MPKNANTNGAGAEPSLDRLRKLRLALLRLHKALFDSEREEYESVFGQVSSGELLLLVIDDPQFAWLHVISELIVRMDEMFDSDKPGEDAEELIKQTRALVQPSASHAEFQHKYFAALQRSPDAVLAHREVTLLF